MAFASSNITAAPREGMYQLQVYKATGDSLQTVASATASTYFVVHEENLLAGDFILAEGSDGRGLYQITSKSTSSITLTPVGVAMRIPNTDDANSKFVFYQTSTATLKTVASATATDFFVTHASLLNSGDAFYIRASDGQGLFRVTSADASTAPTLAPISDVYAIVAATTTANVVPYGVLLSTIAGTTTTFTLDMPWGQGQVKRISHIGTSTAMTVQTASTAAGAINSTMNTVLFNAPNQYLELVGASTSQWAVVSQSQPGTAIIGPAVS